jgi:histidinol-phosphate phosphatase family protein
MSGERVLFLDRDGTLNEETADEQIDSLEKIRFMPGVIPALLELKRAGFVFVMVTNQDGLGTPSLPTEKFDPPHEFIVRTLASQGIEFDAICICPHFKHENCGCRKPEYRDGARVSPSYHRQVGQLHDRRSRHRPRIRRQLRRHRHSDTHRRHRSGNLARHYAAHPRCVPARPSDAQDQRDRHLHRPRPLPRGADQHRAPASVSSITCWNKSPSTVASR